MKTLITLDLGHNGIRDLGAQHLANALAINAVIYYIVSKIHSTIFPSHTDTYYARFGI